MKIKTKEEREALEKKVWDYFYKNRQHVADLGFVPWGPDGAVYGVEYECAGIRQKVYGASVIYSVGHGENEAGLTTEEVADHLGADLERQPQPRIFNRDNPLGDVS